MSYRYTEKDRKNFEVPAEELAPWLIGKVLCHKIHDDKEGDFVIRGRICETEAYRPCDIVTDANRENGGTQLLPGGHLHYFNGGRNRSRMDIVAGNAGSPQSVLIRGIDPYGSHPMLALIAMDLDHTPKVDGFDLLSENGDIWLEDDGVVVSLDAPKVRINVPDNEPLNFRVQSFTFKYGK